jgi:predicted metal-binding membrane protein
MLAWATSLRWANGMPAGLPQFILLWTVMMAAMMLPSALPAVLLFATVARSRRQLGFRPAPAAAFVLGYLGTWALTGVAAAWLNPIGEAMLMWRPTLVGGALILAGVYQLTRWKALCLGHCRTPLHFFMEHWQDGPVGALRMGAHHGLYCLACCWGLMLALLALGMMNPAWMGLIALLIALEKIAPQGERVALGSGLAAIAFGVATAFGWLALPATMGGM